MIRRALLLGVLGALVVAAPRAWADDTGHSSSEEAPKTERAEKDPFATKPGYVQLFATGFVGTGFRFNNPYRLSTPLGDSAESVSRTATYVDLGLAATFGDPLGLQHGVSFRTTAAVEGVGQVIVTPSYFAYRRWRSLAAYGRAGIPVVLTPDVTWGLEAGVGGAWYFLGGIGLAGEIVGDIYYGTGTADVGTATYPVLSGQLGLIFSYEAFP